MNTVKGLISVIVPVWNVKSRYTHALEDLLKSLQVQTYQNVEFVVVDDGSTDTSGEVCDSFASADSRFHVYHIENIGMSKARNYGLKHSNGEYIFFSDSDDLIHPQCLEIMFSLLDKNRDSDIVVGEVSSEETVKFSFISNPSYSVNNKNEFIRMIFRKHYAAWNRLFRRSVIGDELFKDIRHEDFDFCVRVYKKAKNIILLNHVTYHYILYPEGDHFRQNSDVFVERLQTIASVYQNEIKDCDKSLRSACLHYLYYMFIEFYNRPKLDKTGKRILKKNMIPIKKATWKDFWGTELSILTKCELSFLYYNPSLVNWKVFKWIRSTFRFGTLNA